MMITESSKKVIPFGPHDARLVGEGCFYLDLIVWLNGDRIELGERVGLPDQPGQFRQRIALALRRRIRVRAAIVIVGGGKRSVLITISHREDASPSGQRQPAMTTEP